MAVVASLVLIFLRCLRKRPLLQNLWWCICVHTLFDLSNTSKLNKYLSNKLLWSSFSNFLWANRIGSLTRIWAKPVLQVRWRCGSGIADGLQAWRWQLAAVRAPPGPGHESDVVRRLSLNTMQRPGHAILAKRRSQKKKKPVLQVKQWDVSYIQNAIMCILNAIGGPTREGFTDRIEWSQRPGTFSNNSIGVRAMREEWTMLNLQRLCRWDVPTNDRMSSKLNHGAGRIHQECLGKCPMTVQKYRSW